MILIQMTGLSGAGKTTLATNLVSELQTRGFRAEAVDGDYYRQNLCADLGFSKADRLENIRRLSFVAEQLVKHDVITVIAAINPYEAARREVAAKACPVLTVWIKCDLAILQKRDPKGLYRRATLPPDHPEKISDLSGINDPFEIPPNADLVINTATESVAESTEKLTRFVLAKLAK